MKGWIIKTLVKNNKALLDEEVNRNKKTGIGLQDILCYDEKLVLKEKIFIKYPDRIEDSGKKRIYLSESGLSPFFEIFIWEDNNQKVRMDFHYNVHDNERVLTWNKNSGFFHAAVNSERPDVYGSKRMQTVAGQSDFIWTDLREKYTERMKATYGIFENRLVTSVNAYREIKEILEFVLKIIDDKYFG